MNRVEMCRTDEFCMSQFETGGDCSTGGYNPLEYHCTATVCQYPGKQCLFVRNGGCRPV